MKYVLLASILFVTACGSGDGPGGGEEGASNVYNQTAVSGMIGGVPWTYATARVKMSMTPGAEDNVGSFELVSDDVANICGGALLTSSDNLKVLFSAALIPGETLLGASGKSVSLGDNSTNQNNFSVAQDGKFALDSVTDAVVAGRLIAYYDDANQVNGIFTATRCCALPNGLDYEVCAGS